MDNPVQEIIDERIIKLLGLDYGDVLSYEDYYRELRELIAKNSFGENRFSDDFLAFLVNERKRVAKKPGVFKVKKTKVTQNKKSKQGATKFLGPSFQSKTAEVKDKQTKKVTRDPLLNLVKAIRKTVDSINKILIEQNKFIQSTSERSRKELELQKRKGKEEELEKEDKTPFENIKKILAPVEGLLDRIKRFIFFTLLGRAFKLFMDWTSDPKNKKKLESVGRFLKDWWPVLLSAWFFFANPLGRFIRTIIGTVAKLTFKLARFAIPRLLKFIAANPKAAAATAILGTAVLANEVTGQRQAASVQAENKARAQTGKGLGIQGTDTMGDKTPSVGNMGSTNPYGLLQPISTGGLVGLNKGGLIPNVFSGIVDQNTGETVSGAGPDTQFLPVEGGGGAVLQKGETVLQVGARERMIKQTGVDPLAYNIGSNANKPRSIAANMLASSNGGILGFNNGGMIGDSPKNPNFWITAAISGKEAGHIPQGQADVAQSIYNRAKMGIHPGGRDIRKIITAPGQYQPTFGNPAAWNSIKDRNSAINAVKDSKLVDMAAKSILNPTLQKNAANFVGSRTDFQGESQKPHMKPDKGDVTRGKRHNFFGWFTDNAYESRMSSPTSPPFAGSTTSSNNKKEKSKEPSLMDRIGSAFSSFMGTNKTQKKKGGGMIVGENSGYNLKGRTDDRQAYPILGGGIGVLEPGEGIVPADVMRNIGEDNFNRLIATFESGRNSNAAKLGYTKPKVSNIGPPMRKGNNKNMITLPAITSGSSGGGGGSGSSPNINEFSAISTSSLEIRSNLSSLYGIVG